MKMSMWLRREIRLACAYVVVLWAVLSDEQMEAEGGWGSGRLKSPLTRDQGGSGWRGEREAQRGVRGVDAG